MRKFCRSVGRAVKLTIIFVWGAIELVIWRPATREQRAEWLHRFCARVIRAMHIAMRIEGNFPEHGVVVSNHMGYLDVMVFGAQNRCVFISKADLSRVPLLGWMTTMAGTVYVEPGSGGSATRAKASLLATAAEGVPIVIFPEGTTTDGTSMLPFRSGVLAQVLEGGLNVTAAFVSYRFTEDNGPGVSIQNDVAFWGDDAKLFPHIFGVLGLRGIEVHVRIAEHPIVFTATHLHRKQAAIEARAAVLRLGGFEDVTVATP